MMMMKTTTTTAALLLVTVLVLAATNTVNGLDLEIQNVQCVEDQGYAITATMVMSCNDDDEDGSSSSRCTMGNTADISGQITLNGIANTGVQNDMVCLNAIMYADTTASVSVYDFNKDEVDLCDGTYINVDVDEDDEEAAGDEQEAEGGERRRQLQDEDGEGDGDGQEEEEEAAAEEGECPGDGSYNWKRADFLVPDANVLSSMNEFWLTGFNPYINLKFDDCSGNTIGDCTVTFKTYSSTSSAEDGAFQSMMTGKSAAIAIGVLVTLLALLTCYCCFCRRRGSAQTKDEEKTVSETEFTRMEDPVVREQDSAVPTQSTPNNGPAWSSV